MKKTGYCIFLLILLNSTFTFSQEIKKPLVKKFAGIAVGPETGIGLPKFEILAENGTEEKAFYFGGGASLWFLFVAYGSINLETGYRYKNILFDASISRWMFLSKSEKTSASERFGYSTFNPKVGMEFKNVQFKIGPSIVYGQTYSFPIGGLPLLDITKIGRVLFNFELSLPIKPETFK